MLVGLKSSLWRQISTDTILWLLQNKQICYDTLPCRQIPSLMNNLILIMYIVIQGVNETLKLLTLRHHEDTLSCKHHCICHASECGRGKGKKLGKLRGNLPKILPRWLTRGYGILLCVLLFGSFQCVLHVTMALHHVSIPSFFPCRIAAISTKC